MTRLRSGLAAESGVTLVELLVTMVVLAIIASSTLAVTTSLATAQRRADGLQTTLDASRVALDRVRRDARGARRVFDDPSGRHLQLWLDRDADQVLDAAEVVHYELVADGDGARLETWSGATAARRVIVRDLVLTAPFTYDLPSPATRVIGIAFTVVDGGADATATADVRLRNVE